MADLELDNITFKFNPDDSYEGSNGKTYEYVSIKKISEWKGKQKFQTLTIKHDHFQDFKRWLAEELGLSQEPIQQGFPDEEETEDIPEETTDLEPF